MKTFLEKIMAGVFTQMITEEPSSALVEKGEMPACCWCSEQLLQYIHIYKAQKITFPVE